MEDYVVGAVAEIISGGMKTDETWSFQKQKRKSEKSKLKSKTADMLLFDNVRKKTKEDNSCKQFEQYTSNCGNLYESASVVEDTSKKTENTPVMCDREERTIFIGNLPKNVKKHKLKKWLSKFGEIETIRLRSAPLSDPRIPKKVAAIKKNFHEQRNIIHAYVRFSDKHSAVTALQANGELFDATHHVRIDMASNKDNYDKGKSIFLGNLPFGAEEEEIRKLFESCGEIDNIRVIRDNATGIGKGIGYVNFKTEDAVQLALQMDGIQFQKRDLRIKKCTRKIKESKKSVISVKPNTEHNISTKNVSFKRPSVNKRTVKDTFQGICAIEKKKKIKNRKMNNEAKKKKKIRNVLTNKKELKK